MENVIIQVEEKALKIFRNEMGVNDYEGCFFKPSNTDDLIKAISYLAQNNIKYSVYTIGKVQDC